MTDHLKPALYLTDDRDLDKEDLRTLVIFPGGNGDWYVQVAGENGRTSEGMRICTSGGASSSCPGLPVAIAEAYRAIKDMESGDIKPKRTRDDLEREVEAWRSAYPDREFRYGTITDM